jgi:predicted ribonuclease YlaK
MIKCPLLVKELSETYPIVLSKQVFTELDKKKTDKEIGANARMAMRTIESIQKRDGELEIIAIDETFLKENGFSLESPDDIIVGTCLKRQKNEENILFVSEDRGARITAKNAKLNVLYF